MQGREPLGIQSIKFPHPRLIQGTQTRRFSSAGPSCQANTAAEGLTLCISVAVGMRRCLQPLDTGHGPISGRVQGVEGLGGKDGVAVLEDAAQLLC
jgi:hypothetical protein